MSFVRLLAPVTSTGLGVTWTVDTVQPPPLTINRYTDMTCFLFAVKCAVNTGSVSPHCTFTPGAPPRQCLWWSLVLYSHTSDTLQGFALKHCWPHLLPKWISKYLGTVSVCSRFVNRICDWRGPEATVCSTNSQTHSRQSSLLISVSSGAIAGLGWL